MRKFLISSPNYTGQAALVYDAEGLLVVIDLTEAKMNRAIISSFKNRVPDHVSDMQAVFGGTKATVVEADFEVSFEMLWKKYNKKINKSRCMLLWAKMDKSMQVLAFMGIDGYDKYLRKESWRSKADPETYLRNRYWENEYR